MLLDSCFHLMPDVCHINSTSDTRHLPDTDTMPALQTVAQHQINLSCLLGAQSSRSTIYMIYWKSHYRVALVFRRFLSEIFIKKYSVVQKLDHLTCSNFPITMSLCQPINPLKLHDALKHYFASLKNDLFSET